MMINVEVLEEDYNELSRLADEEGTNISYFCSLVLGKYLRTRQEDEDPEEKP